MKVAIIGGSATVFMIENPCRATAELLPLPAPQEWKPRRFGDQYPRRQGEAAMHDARSLAHSPIHWFIHSFTHCDTAFSPKFWLEFSLE